MKNNIKNCIEKTKSLNNLKNKKDIKISDICKLILNAAKLTISLKIVITTSERLKSHSASAILIVGTTTSIDEKMIFCQCY